MKIDVPISTAAGTDTYTVSLDPTVTAHVTNQIHYIKFTNANTGAATLNPDGVGAKSIKKNGTVALENGDIATDQIVQLIYDGADYQLLTPKTPFSTGTNTGDNSANSSSVAHVLATAASDFIVASGVGVFVKKTLAEVKTILGLVFGTGSGQYVEGNDSRFDKNITVDSTVTATTHTGDTNNFVLGTLTIPISTFKANDRMVLEYLFSNAGTAAAKIYRMYLNTTADLSGSPLLLGTFSTATSAVDGTMERRYAVTSTTVMQNALPGATSGISDSIAQGNLTSYAMDNTVIQYLVFTGQCGNSADTVGLIAVSVERRRK